MSYASKYYVTQSNFGDLAMYGEAYSKLDIDLDAAVDAIRLAGYLCRVFESQAALDGEDLIPEPVIKAAGGVFPCLWVNITWVGVPPGELAAIESKYALKRT